MVARPGIAPDSPGFQAGASTTVASLPDEMEGAPGIEPDWPVGDGVTARLGHQSSTTPEEMATNERIGEPKRSTTKLRTPRGVRRESNPRLLDPNEKALLTARDTSGGSDGTCSRFLRIDSPVSRLLRPQNQGDGVGGRSRTDFFWDTTRRLNRFSFAHQESRTSWR